MFHFMFAVVNKICARQQETSYHLNHTSLLICLTSSFEFSVRYVFFVFFLHLQKTESSDIENNTIMRAWILTFTSK